MEKNVHAVNTRWPAGRMSEASEGGPTAALPRPTQKP